MRPAQLQSAAIDASSASFARSLADLGPAVVAHTAGPFQGQDYRVAQACLRCGAHYLDLADGRGFVTGIGALNDLATAAGVLVTSGASSVPALSAAVVDRLARGLAELRSIDIGISPGNRTERGLSTVQGILSYCGKPLPGPLGRPSHGWVGAHRHRYPAPVGQRWLSPCDVPDLCLLPARYTGTPEVRFGAGLELVFLHRAMNGMALLAKWGLVRDWSVHARALKRAADLFRKLGSDAGAMHVSVSGRDVHGQWLTRRWHLLATQGHGPYVPTLAAAALVRRLSAGAQPLAGAMPCLGLLSLDDFAKEAEGLSITTEIEE